MNSNINAVVAEITPSQLSKMRHCVGLNKKKKPNRNYFFLSSESDEWNDLVEKGLATKTGGWGEGSVYYRLTFEAVKMLYGKRISKKYYDEL